MYTHAGRAPVYIQKQPIDADSTDWVYFVYEDWLRLDEVIVEHTASIVGGEIITDSVLIGEMADEDGVLHNDVYGVQVKPTTGSSEVAVTHRVSTETVGSLDLGRLNIDRTVIVSVGDL